MSKTNKAFTLMEVIVVMVIVSVMAAFAIPNYGRSIERADERNIIANLIAMRAAAAMYTVDGTAVAVWNGLPAINANLGLSILDPRATYSCQPNGTGTLCRAIHNAGGWEIHFHDAAPPVSIHCTGAIACPTCPATAAGCG